MAANLGNRQGINREFKALRAEWLPLLEDAATWPALCPPLWADAATWGPPVEPERLNEYLAKWNNLRGLLDIPLCQSNAMKEAIFEGRWRTADNPRAYIKTVAKRIYRKEKARELRAIKKKVEFGVSELNPEDSEVPDEEWLEKQAGKAFSAEATRGPDRIWRRGNGTTRADGTDTESWRGGFETHMELLLSKLPAEYTVTEKLTDRDLEDIRSANEEMPDFYISTDPIIRPNWIALANRAGFDKYERLVLICYVGGKGRKQALSERRSEKGRKALQAAWRRFARTGMQRFQEAIKKFHPKVSPSGSLPTL